jgi:nucleoside-diphosphate-sugar epimerase
MNVAITGGCGFLGRMLAGALVGREGVGRVTLVDVGPGPSGFAPAGGGAWDYVASDLSGVDTCARAVAGAGVIYHLAAVVSGQAEAEFDVGMRVNIGATRNLLEAARASGSAPRLVFASSLAVFGPPFPGVVSEDTAVSPRSSYGTQKAVGELLVCDYSRRGFVDGRVVRLPTVCVRPGAPNAAASSFVSGIIREPLQGRPAVCPVGREQALWLTSPATALRNLLHASQVEAAALGSGRIVNLPGITVTVGEMLAALSRVGGQGAEALVEFRDIPEVRRIVASWPARFDVSRALSLGFARDEGFDSFVREFRDGLGRR